MNLEMWTIGATLEQRKYVLEYLRVTFIAWLRPSLSLHQKVNLPTYVNGSPIPIKEKAHTYHVHYVEHFKIYDSDIHMYMLLRIMVRKILPHCLFLNKGLCLFVSTESLEIF